MNLQSDDIYSSNVNNLLHNNSMFTAGDDSDLLSATASSLTEQQSGPGGQAAPFSGLQFLDRNDLLVKLSRIIFDDFHSHMFPLNNIMREQGEGPTEEAFLDVVQRFLEICDVGVKGIEKVCADSGQQMDPHSKTMMIQLSLERAAYALILRIANSGKLLRDNQNLVCNSFLTKLFRDNDQFRRISTLLLWNEENALFSGSEFGKISEDDAEKLSQLDNIYACSKIRGPVHIDSRFVDRIAAEDEEAVQTLNRVLFSLLRSGRLGDAKTLLQNLEVPALTAFVSVREFLTNPRLSPLDRFDELYDMAKSRLFFKQTARELIPTDDERIQNTDQCIWATIGGHLPTLIAHSQCSEDRLWAYVSCAAEALLDEALLEVHAKGDEEVNLLAADWQRREGEEADQPRDVHSIFAELRNSEQSPYYALYEHLALEHWASAVQSIDQYVSGMTNSGQTVPAHELRFFLHLTILAKLVGLHAAQPAVLDNLVEQYTAMLVQMRLNPLVPFYLFHLSEGRATERMLDFLQEITFESEQKEVLENALRAGFDVPNLCRDVYQRFKSKYKIGEPGQNPATMAKHAEQLTRAWRWLTICDTETVWDAIIEANYLLRKMFLNSLMPEALQLMQLAPENLPSIALEAFQREFPDREVPDKLSDAQREFDCYQLYFETISRYTEWQKHVEGSQAPELPSKLSDERWARMDTRRRTEYELSVQKARDCLQKYYRLVELYKKRAIEMLETVLKTTDGWLVTMPLANEESADEEVLDRANDFVQIRRDYLASLLQLLIDIYQRSDEPMRVLEVATLIMNPRYGLHKALDKDKLRKLLKLISRAGASLL